MKGWGKGEDSAGEPTSYPWAVVFVEEGLKAMAEMGMFLAILAVGLLYGWREGAFRWA